MTARNHHYISQAYLSAFSELKGKNEQVEAFSFSEEKIFSTNIRNVGAKRDFNRIESDECDPNVLENHLADFEGSIKPTIKAVVEKADANENEMSVLLTMIAMYAVRTPMMRKTFESHQEKVLKLVLRQSLATKGRFESAIAQMKSDGYDVEDWNYEEMKDFIDRDEFSIQQGQEQFIDLEMKQLTPMVDMLAQRKWSFLVSDQAKGFFITSDRPVVIEWHDNRNLPPMMARSPGFGMKNSIVYFPLSKISCMVGSFEDFFRGHSTSAETVAHVNSQIINKCSDQIYYHPNGYNFRTGNGEIEAGSKILNHFKTTKPNKSGDGQ